MKITCKLVGGYKKKGEPDSNYYWWLDLASLRQYEELPNQYDVQFELKIVSLNEDGEDVEKLASKKFFKTGKANHYIGFHSVCYCYQEETNTIYSTTIEHNI